MNQIIARAALLAAVIFVSLAAGGCGLVQSLGEAASDVGKAVFHAKVKILRLDFTARDSLNPDVAGQPLSVMVRVYQLKDGKSFESADYASLYAADREVLAQELIILKEVILTPGGAASLSETMDENTKFVGLAAFFREEVGQEWKMLLPLESLSPDKAFKVELVDFSIGPLKEE